MIVLRSGLVALVKDVKAFFAANNLTTNVEIGFLRRERRDNQGTGGANRVIFTPSEESGAGGSVIPPMLVGDRELVDADNKVVATVRALADWERRVDVSVWAIDNAARQDEAAQLEALESLFEWTVRAVHVAKGAYASAKWADVRFTELDTRNFGIELRATLVYRQPLFDAAREVIHPVSAAVNRAPYSPPVVPVSHGDT